MTEPMIHVRVKPQGEENALRGVSAAQVEEFLKPDTSPFIQWYDTIESPAHTIQFLDLAIPGFLAAPPDFKHMLKPEAWREPMLDGLRHASRALSHLPVDVDLWDWIPADDQAIRDERRQLLVELFQSTTGGDNRAIPQYGPATCTKMLHRKRPRLIPIIDSGIYQAWLGKDGSRWRTGEMADIALLLADELRESKRQAELASILHEAPGIRA